MDTYPVSSKLNLPRIPVCSPDASLAGQQAGSRL